jgi:hypothetical protein
MIANPFLGTREEGAWEDGFRWGFFGPPLPVPPPRIRKPERINDAFKQGVSVGQQSAFEGLEPVRPGIDAAEHHELHLAVASNEPHVQVGVGMLGGAISHVAAGVTESLLRLVKLRLISNLNCLPFPSGFDPHATGCEVNISRIFTWFTDELNNLLVLDGIDPQS